MKITLRPATSDDAKRLFNWRNDRETRRQFKNTAPVEWDSHCSWLTRCLTDDLRRLYVAERDGEPAGTVRLDRSGDEFEISYTVAPQHRGKGVGKAMVKAAMQLAEGPVVAEIKTANPASQRIAKLSGMRFVGYRDGLQVWRR